MTAAIAGVGGTNTDAGGTVIATTIGTQDRDSQGGLFYQSPPGVTDQPDSKGSVYSPGTIQVNEQSMRLVAVDVPLYHRAEAFYRFPEGTKNFMGYRQLRVWARGRGKGWGPNGDLQFYIKMGRDADNFYLYRTPVNAGSTVDAWLPEVAVNFARFIALRAQQSRRVGEVMRDFRLDLGPAKGSRSRQPPPPGDQPEIRGDNDGLELAEIAQGIRQTLQIAEIAAVTALHSHIGNGDHGHRRLLTLMG